MRELNVLSVGLLPKYQSGRPAVANPEVAAMRCKLLRGLNAQTVHFKGMPCCLMLVLWLWMQTGLWLLTEVHYLGTFGDSKQILRVLYKSAACP